MFYRLTSSETLLKIPGHNSENELEASSRKRDCVEKLAELVAQRVQELLLSGEKFQVRTEANRDIVWVLVGENQDYQIKLEIKEDPM